MKEPRDLWLPWNSPQNILIIVKFQGKNLTGIMILPNLPYSFFFSNSEKYFPKRMNAFS